MQIEAAFASISEFNFVALRIEELYKQIDWLIDIDKYLTLKCCQQKKQTL